MHAELKRLNGVKPPREFVLMDRAAIGLGSVFMRLRAEVNWYRVFHDLTGGFDVDAVTARQKAALEAAACRRPTEGYDWYREHTASRVLTKW